MSDYSEKLKHPKWQKKRLKILEREGWKCQACGDAESPLQIHHLVYSKGEPWDSPDETLECLCEDCHALREDLNEFFEGRSLMPTKVAYQLWLLLYPVFDGSVPWNPSWETHGFKNRHLHYKILPTQLLLEKTGQLDPAKATVAPSLSASPDETPANQSVENCSFRSSDMERSRTATQVSAVEVETVSPA